MNSSLIKPTTRVIRLKDIVFWPRVLQLHSTCVRHRERKKTREAERKRGKEVWRDFEKPFYSCNTHKLAKFWLNLADLLAHVYRVYIYG